MNRLRRALLLRMARCAAAIPGLVDAAAASAPIAPREAGRILRGRELEFPRDHGAHLPSRVEWWYATGWVGREEAPTHGFQITFFRSRTGLAADSASRFAARHLLFAHAALTDLGDGRHHHAQRIARWSGDPVAAHDRAALHDANLQLGRWRLLRTAGSGEAASAGASQAAAGAAVWQAQVDDQGFAIRARLVHTQALLLQGEAGFSRKGPEPGQASHYYSVPQLAAHLAGKIGAREFTAAGRAWIDHEWSDELLHPAAVGWDWIGMNLFDGSALTAFVLRRADGTALWAGGSLRRAGGTAQDFAPEAVRMRPLRRWRSPATRADYPVQWELLTPAGRHAVRALLDAQELDSRASTGAVYWEGLAELLDESGRRVALGYLEMTGYVAPIRLG